MSQITPEQFRVGWTQTQVDKRINELPMGELEFSQISSLYHRFFGVLTGASDGEQIAKPEARNADRQLSKDSFVLNSCVRYQYPRLVDGIVSNMEAELGYALTDRYITEEVAFPTPSFKFQTLMKGVAKMNVAQVWHDVLLDVSVTPFLELDIPVVEITTGTYGARIDDRLYTNPNDVYLRSADFRTWPWFSDSTSPLSRNKVDHYWQLPINSRARSFAPLTDVINSQHKKYVIVDIPAQTIPTGGVIHPVYAGTNQIIPQAKPMEVVEGMWRFTLYVYTLVHHDFVAETTDLIAGEFWKLYSTIDFKYVIDTAVLPQVIITRGTVVETFEPTLTLVDRELGIFHLNYDSCLPQWDCLCQDWPRTVRLRYSYKTETQYLKLKMQEQIGRLRDAAAARIASELPTYSCNCAVDYGFIAKNQTVYTDTYLSLQTETVVDKVRYGRLHGQLFYAEVMNDAPKYARFIDTTILSNSFLHGF